MNKNARRSLCGERITLFYHAFFGGCQMVWVKSDKLQANRYNETGLQ